MIIGMEFEEMTCRSVDNVCENEEDARLLTERVRTPKEEMSADWKSSANETFLSA